MKNTIRFNLGLLNGLKENPKNQKSVSRLTNFTTRYTTWSWHMGTINYPSRDPCFVIEPTSCSHFFFEMRVTHEISNVVRVEN